MKKIIKTYKENNIIRHLTDQGRIFWKLGELLLLQTNEDEIESPLEQMIRLQQENNDRQKIDNNNKEKDKPEKDKEYYKEKYKQYYKDKYKKDIEEKDKHIIELQIKIQDLEQRLLKVEEQTKQDKIESIEIMNELPNSDNETENYSDSDELKQILETYKDSEEKDTKPII